MSKASWEDTPPVRRLIARVLKLAEPVPGFTRGPIPGGYDEGFVAPLGEYIGYYRNTPTGSPSDYPYVELDVGAGDTGLVSAFLAAEDDEPSGEHYRSAYRGLSAEDLDAMAGDRGQVTIDAAPDGSNLRASAGTTLSAARPAEQVASITAQVDATDDGIEALLAVTGPTSASVRIMGDTAQTQPLLQVRVNGGGSEQVQILPTGDLLIYGNPGTIPGVVLTAANGSFWKLKVSNTGTVSAEAYTLPSGTTL